ncbi:MAG: type II and III secretion system protein family protein [Alphaproteobacteria bacterium]
MKHHYKAYKKFQALSPQPNMVPTKGHIYRTSFVLAALLFNIHSVAAEEKKAVPLPPPPPLNMNELVQESVHDKGLAEKASTGHLLVAVNKGEPIRLPEPASSVFVSDPKVADVQVLAPTMVVVYGRSAGETTVFAVSEDQRVILNRTVEVRPNTAAQQITKDRLFDLVTQRFPGLKLKIEPEGDGIAVIGEVPSPREAADVIASTELYLGGTGKVINRLKITGSTQVNLRVRMAEIRRNVVKDLGFRWDIGMNRNGTANNRFSFGTQTGTGVGSGSEFVRLITGLGRFDLTGFLDMLAEDGLVSILAEPNLTAMSGETASFLAGGEIPIPVPNQNGIVIEWRKYGVSLAFSPTVIDENRINLKVRPEVSLLDRSNEVVIVQGQAGIPAITTRWAETTVELSSGQSFAIAGLLSDLVNQRVEKFPYLEQLPVLGPLFRSNSFRREESELVILVTPYLVNPVPAGQMETPLDKFSAPNDLVRLLDGKMLGEIEKTSEQAALQQPLGQHGFMLPQPVVATPLLPIAASHKSNNQGNYQEGKK